MAKIFQTEDMRKDVELEVSRTLGYAADFNNMEAAMRWGVVALAVLMLSEFVHGFYDFSRFNDIEGIAPHVTVTVMLVAGAGYFYERRRAKKWFDLFEQRMAERLRS